MLLHLKSPLKLNLHGPFQRCSSSHQRSVITGLLIVALTVSHCVLNTQLVLLAVDMHMLNLTLSTQLSDRSLFLYVYSLLIDVNIPYFACASCWLAQKKTKKCFLNLVERFIASKSTVNYNFDFLHCKAHLFLTRLSL